MPVYERCPESVSELASEVLCDYECYQPLLDAKVTIDYLFAMADEDEDGNPVNDAIKCHGVKALAVTKKNTLKQRALGLADAEITIDRGWWEEASAPERKALIDHELFHLELKLNEDGLCKDDLGRPLLTLRPHDVDIGHFHIIADRHGEHSQEVKQCRMVWDTYGQSFFPFLTEKKPLHT